MLATVTATLAEMADPGAVLDAVLTCKTHARQEGALLMHHCVVTCSMTMVVLVAADVRRPQASVC